MPLSRNFLIKSGLGPLTLRDTYVLHLNAPVVPMSIEVFWVVVTLLAMVGAGSVIYYVALATRQAIVNLLDSDCRSRPWPYALFAGISVSYYSVLLVAAASFQLYDRYLLPLLPVFILVICGAKLEHQPTWRQTRVVLSLILLVMYGGFSVAATHDYLSWNRSRWIALHSLIDGGKVPPNQIDGGLEFNGWLLCDAKYVTKPGKSWYWVYDDEYVITFGPLAGYTEMGRYPFHRWLFFNESNIFVLHRAANNN